MTPSNLISTNHNRKLIASGPSRIFPGLFLALLLLAGLTGCSKKLPLEHDLTDKKSQTIQARLEARSDSVLKYTLLSDNSVHYVAIASLADADQEFIKAFPATLTLAYPLETTMGEAGTKASVIKIEGHNADWVRYTRQGDQGPRYAQMGAFSLDDQAVIKQLPVALTVTLPIVGTFKDTAGHLLPETIDWLSHDLVKMSSKDGTMVYYPMHSLSSAEQNLLRPLPAQPNPKFPFDCTLTDKNGKKINISLEGRAANTIKYTLKSDKLGYYALEADFSAGDRELFRLLPSTLDFTLPIENTLTDDKGKSLRVRIEALDSTLVKLTMVDSKLESYWRRDAFSPSSQNFLNILPVGKQFEFPIDYTLITLSGENIKAHLLGRDATAVKYDLDGKTVTVPLSTLSDDSQSFLQLLQPNMSDLLAAAGPRNAADTESPAVQLAAAAASTGFTSGTIRFANATKIPLEIKIGDTAPAPLNVNGEYVYRPANSSSQFIVQILRTDVTPHVPITGSSMSAPSSGLRINAIVTVGNAAQMRRDSKVQPTFNVRFDSMK